MKSCQSLFAVAIAITLIIIPAAAFSTVYSITCTGDSYVLQDTGYSITFTTIDMPNQSLPFSINADDIANAQVNVTCMAFQDTFDILSGVGVLDTLELWIYPNNFCSLDRVIINAYWVDHRTELSKLYGHNFSLGVYFDIGPASLDYSEQDMDHNCSVTQVYPMPGDLDLDDDIDATDLYNFEDAFTNDIFPDADINRDGVIDLDDVARFAQEFGRN